MRVHTEQLSSMYRYNNPQLISYGNPSFAQHDMQCVLGANMRTLAHFSLFYCPLIFHSSLTPVFKPGIVTKINIFLLMNTVFNLPSISPLLYEYIRDADCNHDLTSAKPPDS
jgi:hypothetical protein